MHISELIIICSVVLYAFDNSQALNLPILPLCPISSLFNVAEFKNPQVHSYPIDLFNSETPGIYSCGAHDKTRAQRHICAESSMCPVHHPNLVDADKSKRLRQNVSTSFCHIEKTLKNPQETVNIIILGGSVTAGIYTGGCCCTQEFDTKCPRRMDKSCEFKNEYTSNACSWNMHFFRWLKFISDANVQIINLSYGGQTAPYKADILISELRDKGVYKLNSSDLIFIDHSVNDAHSYPTNLNNDRLHYGLDTLLRRIYHISQSGSWPTIILLEHWPFPSNDIRRKGPEPDVTSLFDGDYSAVYTDVAARFKLPLWSYKDVVWSQYMKTNQSRYVDIMQFHWNKFKLSKAQDVHPPWYAHLFYADMIAGLFTMEMQRCADRQQLKQPQAQGNSKDISSNVLLRGDDKDVDDGDILSHERMSSEMMSAALPPMLSQSSARHCSEKDPPLLSISAAHALQNVSDRIIGVVIYNDSDSDANKLWRLYEDRKGKGGWIAQMVGNESEKTTEVNISSSMIFKYEPKIAYGNTIENKNRNNNNNNNPNNNIIYNNINTTISTSGKYLLSIHYFRSYEHAGVVEVYICGNKIMTLDALWTDYRSYRISMNDIAYYEFIDLASMCKSIEDVQLTFVYTGRTFKTYLPRGQQKFKVVSAELCRFSNDA
eukprot:gene1264-2444_t